MLLGLKIYLVICLVCFVSFAVSLYSEHRKYGYSVHMFDEATWPEFILMLIWMFLFSPISYLLMAVSKTYRSFCTEVTNENIYIPNDQSEPTEKEENDETSE